jgi:hypothetical protein
MHSDGRMPPNPRRRNPRRQDLRPQKAPPTRHGRGLRAFRPKAIRLLDRGRAEPGRSQIQRCCASPSRVEAPVARRSISSGGHPPAEPVSCPSGLSVSCPSDRVRLAASWRSSMPAPPVRASVLSKKIERFRRAQVRPQQRPRASPARPQPRPQDLCMTGSRLS